MIGTDLVTIAPPPGRDTQTVLTTKLAAVAWGEIWKEKIITISPSSASFNHIFCVHIHRNMADQSLGLQGVRKETTNVHMYG